MLTFISFVGYSLLILYCIYCITFCCAIAYTLILENRERILRTLQFSSSRRRQDYENFQMVVGENLGMIDEI